MLITRKLQATALLSTIIISLILFTTCTIVLLGIYHFRHFQTADEINDQLDMNLESGITMVLNNYKVDAVPIKDSFVLFNSASDSIYLTKELWGIFPLITITAVYKKRKKNKSFLLGASHHNNSDAVLYLTDHNIPLSVKGDSHIKGKVYLPKAGFRSGFFSDNAFASKKLIEGEMATSNNKLPELNIDCIRYFQMLVQMGKHSPDAPLLTDKQVNSFKKDAAIFRSETHALPNNCSLSGKIVVITDSILEVDKAAHLQDVILIAPYIRFKEGFSGTVQAFALDSITVEENCFLKYPSSIVTINRPVFTGNNITIQKGSIVEGAIIALSGREIPAVTSVIDINKEATVRGLIYNEGHTLVQGKIEGAVFTDFFAEKKIQTGLKNILTDASIKESNWLLQAHYFTLFEGSNRNKIIKWLL